MISLAFIVLFLLCIAAAVYATLVSYRLITTYSDSFQRYYFYYLVSFYAFAVYGLWGQIILRQLLLQMSMAVAMIEKIANFLPLLGIPFLFISWIMLLSTAYALFERKTPSIWMVIHAILFIVLVVGSWLGYTIEPNVELLAGVDRKYFLVLILLVIELLYYLAFLFVVLGQTKDHGEKRKRKTQFAVFICLAVFSRMAMAFVAYQGGWWLAIALLVYFVSNVLPLLYLNMHSETLFQPIRADHPDEYRFERLFAKYKITKREKEIVQQICAGKTNQQIADTLFISLQTVKDHTHRIYTKVGIKSRMQLVRLISS